MSIVPRCLFSHKLSWHALILNLTALIVFSGSALSEPFEIPVLLYHRFGSQVKDTMTVRTKVFEEQLHELEREKYKIIPLKLLVDYLLGKGPPPPARSVVITVDDGHRSVYTELLPVILRHRIPVTLFIYPSAISNASYAMTWDQLRELRATGFFDIQSHTYWHPNFKKEKRRLSPDAYSRFVDMQFVKSKELIHAKLGGDVNVLAWPFGLYDSDLERHARLAGYVAAVTMDRHPATGDSDPMEIPRFLITDGAHSIPLSAILKTIESASTPGSR
jgi:peptidoglycan/xylan/chitin deacetylase (PgdA/CDA1 family)